MELHERNITNRRCVMEHSVFKIGAWNNYSEILDYAKTTIPIRKSGKSNGYYNNAGKIPLGLRRNAYEYHVKINPDTQSVECYYYKDPLLVWHPDNSVSIFLHKWANHVEAKYIAQVLKLHLYGQFVGTHKGKMYLIGDGFQKSLLLNQGSETKLKFFENKPWRYWKVVNPVQEYTHAVDRKALNKIKKPFAPFIDYAKAVMAIDSKFGKTCVHVETNPMMTVNELTEEQANQLTEIYEEPFCWFDKPTDNTEDMHKALILLARGVYDTKVVTKLNLGGVFTYRWHQNYAETSKAVIDNLYKLLKVLYFDDIFIKKPVELGRPCVDVNIKYYVKKARKARQVADYASCLR